MYFFGPWYPIWLSLRRWCHRTLKLIKSQKLNTLGTTAITLGTAEIEKDLLVRTNILVFGVFCKVSNIFTWLTQFLLVMAKDQCHLGRLIQTLNRAHNFSWVPVLEIYKYVQIYRHCPNNFQSNYKLHTPVNVKLEMVERWLMNGDSASLIFYTLNVCLGDKKTKH